MDSDEATDIPQYVEPPSFNGQSEGNNQVHQPPQYRAPPQFPQGSKQDKDKEKLDKILKATRRGSALCKQVMTFSRDMSVEKKDLSLAEVVQEAMKLLSVVSVAMMVVFLTDTGVVRGNISSNI